jgi:hypothetical protein
MPRVVASLASKMPTVILSFQMELIKAMPSIAASFVTSLVSEAPRFVTELVKSIPGAIGDAGSGLLGGVGDIFGGGGGGGGIGGAIGGVVGTVTGAVGGFVDSVGDIFGWAEGGKLSKVRSPILGQDVVPARLMAGELVIDKNTTSKLENFLDGGGSQSGGFPMGGLTIKIGQREFGRLTLDQNRNNQYTRTYNTRRIVRKF